MTQELLLSPHGKGGKDDIFKLSHDIHLLNFHHNVDLWRLYNSKDSSGDCSVDSIIVAL